MDTIFTIVCALTLFVAVPYFIFLLAVPQERREEWAARLQRWSRKQGD